MSEPSLADRAYDELREAIVAERLSASPTLAEAELAAMLGVSRTTVREALRRCELEGYLTRDAQGRLTIEQPTAEKVDQLFLVRELLEAYAVRLAAERISDAELARLDDLVAQDVEALRGRHADRLAELNAEIHGTILGASRNRTLVDLMDSFAGRAHGLDGFAVGDSDDRRRFVEDHHALLQLLRAGDADGAEALIRSHLGHAREVLRAGLPSDAPD